MLFSLHLVLAVGLVLSSTRSWAAHRVALLVTAENGLSNETPLKHVQEDAARLEETLLMVSSFTRENIHRLDAATPDKVFRKLKTLEEDMAGKRETLLIVYYSGHAGATSLHMNGETLAYTELRQRLEAFQATLKIGIIDACNSGGIIGKGSLARASFTVDDSLKMKGTVILTSSSWNQHAIEQGSMAGSIFSHHLISGLRGAADKNSDGKVSLEEVYQYAYLSTLADTRKQGWSEQEPQFKHLDVKGKGPVILSWLVMARARLTLPRGQDVCFITNEDERRLILEGHSEPDRELHMALKPDSYVLKCRRQDEGLFRKASFSMAAGEHRRAATLEFMEVQQQDILRKGAREKLRPRCTFDIVAQSIYVERNQRTNVANLEGLLELRVRFSADDTTAPFYPSSSTVVTMNLGETLRMNQFVTRVTIDERGRVPLSAELWEIEYGFQGEDDYGSQRGSLHLDCSRASDVAELPIPISADTLLEKSGTVVVQYIATRH